MTQSELIRDQKLIKKVTLDYQGNDIMIVGFQFWKTYQPFSVQRISERYTTGVIPGNFSVN